jgi:hypothetical protein
VETHVAEDRVEALSEAGGEAAVHRESHARIVLASDAVGIDPDDVFSVGPLQQFDISTRDAIEADIQKLPELAVGGPLDHEVELVVDAEAIGERDRTTENGHIVPALALRHTGGGEGFGEIPVDPTSEALRAELRRDHGRRLRGRRGECPDLGLAHGRLRGALPGSWDRHRCNDRQNRRSGDAGCESGTSRK